MTTETIDIDKLKPGMFVVKVDSSSSLSFSFQNFRVKNTNDIKRLKETGVKKLIIDLEKSQTGAESIVGKRVPVFPEPVKPLKAEMGQAKKVQTQAKETLGKVMDSALEGQPVEAKALTPVVNQTLDSLIRNDQALLTLMHMKRHGEALISHAFSVMSLATAVAQRLQFSQEEIEAVGMAAMMYDVGWLRLPANLVTKGRAFTDKEQKLVERHPDLGLQIARKSPDLPETVYRIVIEHHELLDGSGYPNNINQASIHPLSQVITVCDIYDNMVHGMMGYQGRTPNAALKELYNESRNGKLDGSVIAILVHLLGVYPITSAVRLNTGELAVVIEMNRKNTILPIVKICYDEHGTPLSSPLEIDLANQKGRNIQRSIEKIIDPNQPNVDPKGILLPER